MTPEMAARLSALNADFYARFGEDFGETRPRVNPGVQRVLGQILAGSTVIDIGCGDGKVGRRVAGGRYLGLDSSAALLTRACGLTRDSTGNAVAPLEASALAAWPGSGPNVAFAQVDVLGQGVGALSAGVADWVVAFALLHHIPRHAQRVALLRAMAGWLKPGGRLAVSCWQPQRSPRFARLVRPWSEGGLDPAELEPADLLLGWERGGRSGLRYVRVIDADEMHALIEAAGLLVLDGFSDDGHARNLADYVICTTAEASTLSAPPAP